MLEIEYEQRKDQVSKQKISFTCRKCTGGFLTARCRQQKDLSEQSHERTERKCFIYFHILDIQREDRVAAFAAHERRKGKESVSYTQYREDRMAALAVCMYKERMAALAVCIKKELAICIKKEYRERTGWPQWQYV